VTRATAVAVVAALVLSWAGVGLAASFTLTTARLGGTGLTTPVMYPYVVTTANAGGKAAPGRIDRNDTVSVVWSRPIDQPTLCSGLSNGTPTSSATMTWIVQNNTGTTGNDVLVPGTVPGCTSGMHVGSIDLGSPGYINGSNGTFAAATTTVSVSATITSLQVTIPGAPSGGTVGTVSSGSAAVWTPDPAVTDLAGRNCGASLAQTAATVQF
jgi:hypothetical protein